MGELTIFGAQPDAVARVAKIRDGLRPMEIKIIDAAGGKIMANYDLPEFFECARVLSQRVCDMVGLRHIDYVHIKYFADFLRNYYSDLTFREVLTAFELSLVGELDMYLPKDRNGYAEKNHYQSFSNEYVSRILNAYRRRKGDVEVKSIELLPKALPEKTEEEKTTFVRMMYENIKRVFLKYKYTGRMDATQMNELTIYRELDKLGLAEPIRVTDDDKKMAVVRLNGKVRNGVFNDFVGGCIRHLQERHPYVPDEAVFIARSRAVKESFDAIIKMEIQLTDLLPYGNL